MTTWADQFNTYDEACEYYGCDTPGQLRAEAEQHEAEWLAQQALIASEYGPHVEPRYWAFPWGDVCNPDYLRPGEVDRHGVPETPF